MWRSEPSDNAEKCSNAVYDRQEKHGQQDGTLGKKTRSTTIIHIRRTCFRCVLPYSLLFCNVNSGKGILSKSTSDKPHTMYHYNRRMWHLIDMCVAFVVIGCDHGAPTDELPPRARIDCGRLSTAGCVGTTVSQRSAVNPYPIPSSHATDFPSLLARAQKRRRMCFTFMELLLITTQ